MEVDAVSAQYGGGNYDAITDNSVIIQQLQSELSQAHVIIHDQQQMILQQQQKIHDLQSFILTINQRNVNDIGDGVNIDDTECEIGSSVIDKLPPQHQHQSISLLRSVSLDGSESMETGILNMNNDDHVANRKSRRHHDAMKLSDILVKPFKAALGSMSFTNQQHQIANKPLVQVFIDSNSGTANRELDPNQDGNGFIGPPPAGPITPSNALVSSMKVAKIKGKGSKSLSGDIIAQPDNTDEVLTTPLQRPNVQTPATLRYNEIKSVSPRLGDSYRGQPLVRSHSDRSVASTASATVMSSTPSSPTMTPTANLSPDSDPGQNLPSSGPIVEITDRNFETGILITGAEEGSPDVYLVSTELAAKTPNQLLRVLSAKNKRKPRDGLAVDDTTIPAPMEPTPAQGTQSKAPSRLRRHVSAGNLLAKEVSAPVSDTSGYEIMESCQSSVISEPKKHDIKLATEMVVSLAIAHDNPQLGSTIAQRITAGANLTGSISRTNGLVSSDSIMHALLECKEDDSGFSVFILGRIGFSGCLEEVPARYGEMSTQQTPHSKSKSAASRGSQCIVLEDLRAVVGMLKDFIQRPSQLQNAQGVLSVHPSEQVKELNLFAINRDAPSSSVRQIDLSIAGTIVSLLSRVSSRVDVIFDPIVSSDNWYPYYEGHRKMAPQFRSRGVGYIRLGNDMSLHGTSFLSVDGCRSFVGNDTSCCDESNEVMGPFRKSSEVLKKGIPPSSLTSKVKSVRSTSKESVTTETALHNVSSTEAQRIVQGVLDPLLSIDSIKSWSDRVQLLQQAAAAPWNRLFDLSPIQVSTPSSSVITLLSQACFAMQSILQKQKNPNVVSSAAHASGIILSSTSRLVSMATVPINSVPQSTSSKGGVTAGLTSILQAARELLVELFGLLRSTNKLLHDTSAAVLAYLFADDGMPISILQAVSFVARAIRGTALQSSKSNSGENSSALVAVVTSAIPTAAYTANVLSVLTTVYERELARDFGVNIKANSTPTQGESSALAMMAGQCLGLISHREDATRSAAIKFIATLALSDSVHQWSRPVRNTPRSASRSTEGVSSIVTKLECAALLRVVIDEVLIMLSATHEPAATQVKVSSRLANLKSSAGGGGGGGDGDADGNSNSNALKYSAAMAALADSFSQSMHYVLQITTETFSGRILSKVMQHCRDSIDSLQLSVGTNNSSELCPAESRPMSNNAKPGKSSAVVEPIPAEPVALNSSAHTLDCKQALQRLSEQSFEANLLLRKAPQSEDQWNNLVQGVRVGGEFFALLSKVSSSVGWSRGKIVRAVLPFDENTSTLDQSKISSKTEDFNLLSELIAAQQGSANVVDQLSTMAVTVRALIRVKLADEADLQQGQQACRELAKYCAFFQDIQTQFSLPISELLLHICC